MSPDLHYVDQGFLRASFTDLYLKRIRVDFKCKYQSLVLSVNIFATHGTPTMRTTVASSLRIEIEAAMVYNFPYEIQAEYRNSLEKMTKIRGMTEA